MVHTHGLSHIALALRVRLTRPEDIDAAVAAVEKAGGSITSRGEFAPGFPFAYARDPDGYEIEIW